MARKTFLVPIRITRSGMAVVEATSAKKAAQLANDGDWIDVLPDDDAEQWEVTGAAQVEP